ncbi:hypothetical protein [Pedobacter frigiditerrae]|uniref:hypothetical protein n=1 Tax=Pedobacter frigiditerrae TaxID=2530452 RepID=UPI00292D0417|nr:hypothetical protein [Pedobacter frigiditerrae]
MNKFSSPVRRKITAVRRELLAYGLKGQYLLQPFALIVVLFTKPASKGLQKKQIINNRLTIT